MIENTGTQELVGGSAPATGSAQETGGVDSALEWFWHFLTSMKLALILMLVFALFTFLGTFIIQMPPDVTTDAARQDWLAGIRPRYGSWTDILDRLQLFSVFTSVWLRLIGAFLVASLVACTVQRIPGTWRNMTRPRVSPGEAFFEHAPQHEAMIFQRQPAEVLSTTSEVLRRHGYRTLTEGDGTVGLYFDRNRWAPWGGLVAHLAVVVILGGAMVGSLFGYRNSQFMLAEGSTSVIPGHPDATLTLNSFKDTYNTSTGAPLDYVSFITVSEGGKPVSQHEVRVNDPLRYRNISFFQAFFGPAAVMTVRDAAGATISAQGVPLAFTANQAGNKVGSLSLSGRNITAWVMTTLGPSDPTVKPGQVLVELYASDTGAALAQQVLEQGQPTTIGGLSFTFEREAKFTGLSVANDPGMPIVWTGCILLVLGFTIRLYVPYRRIWGRLTPRAGGTSLAIAAVGRRDSGLDNEFTAIVTDIRQALVAQAKS